MILSDTSILEYIEANKILILPEFDKKDIRPAGVRLHLGAEVLIPKNGQTIDLTTSQEVAFDKIAIPAEGFILKPGDFVLSSTFERFLVPKNIVCHIEGRSTVARLGMAIHCTSSIVDGNYQEPRTVVLEIKNQGNFNLVLKPKLAVAMLSFTQLTSEIKQNAQAQYSGQNGAVPPNLKVQKQ